MLTQIVTKLEYYVPRNKIICGWECYKVLNMSNTIHYMCVVGYIKNSAAFDIKINKMLWTCLVCV